FFSRNLTASPTVRIVSAASSGISQPNSSSKAITNSTVSRLSAPRSSMKLAFSVTLSGSTPKCSTTIFFTRSPMSLIVQPLMSCNRLSRPRDLRSTRADPSWVIAAGALRSRVDRLAPAPTASSFRPAKRGFGYHTSNALTSTPEGSEHDDPGPANWAHYRRAKPDETVCSALATKHQLDLL